MVPPRTAFTPAEWKIIGSHRTPAQVQSFLSSLPYNREPEGATCRSFRGVVKEKKAHCLEAALTATVILEQHGYPPLLVSIESQDLLDHVLFLFRENGKYGAVARSRDIGLHGRKPVFRTVRDLVMSYFDTYVDKTGRVVGYGVADLNDLGNYDWRFSTRNVWRVEKFLQEIHHNPLRSSERRYQKAFKRYLEFQKENPGKSADYFKNRHLWML
ncbi:MAG TPA: hypothetical protein VNH22_04980 [Blastocatellia bacterium]|jgi:hypothetical protein|nr:hypothetical protein [Blastocatellia bacterium]